MRKNINELINCVKTVTDNIFPKTRLSRKQFKIAKKPWITKDIPKALKRQNKLYSKYQRWSPRGQILKSLALASKVKSLALASRPQVLENWPVLGSRTALFFGKLKFCGVVEKFLESVFSWRSLEKFL